MPNLTQGWQDVIASLGSFTCCKHFLVGSYCLPACSDLTQDHVLVVARVTFRKKAPSSGAISSYVLNSRVFGISM